MFKIASLALLCLTAACSTGQTTPKNATAQVQPTLVAPQPAAVDSELLHQRLAERRALNLDRLHAYALAGQFPQNHVRPGMLNVFIDDAGHICAAANLINLDGHDALVQKTAATDNYIVLASVTQGPLMNWMLTSGFTQEEIALIQEPYFFMDEPAEPVQAQKLTSLQIETARVRAVLLGVHERLSASSAQSLGVVATRLQSQPKLAADFSRPSRFAVAP